MAHVADEVGFLAGFGGLSAEGEGDEEAAAGDGGEHGGDGEGDAEPGGPGFAGGGERIGEIGGDFPAREEGANLGGDEGTAPGILRDEIGDAGGDGLGIAIEQGDAGFFGGSGDDIYETGEGGAEVGGIYDGSLDFAGLFDTVVEDKIEGAADVAGDGAGWVFCDDAAEGRGLGAPGTL